MCVVWIVMWCLNYDVMFGLWCDVWIVVWCLDYDVMFGIWCDVWIVMWCLDCDVMFGLWCVVWIISRTQWDNSIKLVLAYQGHIIIPNISLLCMPDHPKLTTQNSQNATRPADPKEAPSKPVPKPTSEHAVSHPNIPTQKDTAQNCTDPQCFSIFPRLFLF